jgi:acetyl/propionyl-CoA carboxylase alpha subunit
MFRKILIANRGEVAVRILRTCREMGLQTVALYEPADRGSLHVRLADEAVGLSSAAGFRDGPEIVRIALAREADAIHPGYGFLAEEAAFIRACAAAGLSFIGPPAEVVDRLRNKPAALECAAAAGFPTLPHSPCGLDVSDGQALNAAAERLGYPLVVKSCRGGRGRGERLVRTPDQLSGAVRWAQGEALTIYGDHSMYLERAVHPARQIGVQVLGDRNRSVIHLGDREGSLVAGNQKILEESPAPCLTPQLRERACSMALALARLFEYENAGTVEFVRDADGQLYFTEIKARLQMEHPLTEMVTGLDLVREQTRLAAGEPLDLEQADVRMSGWAMQCRVSAEDPWQKFRPAPGVLQRLRLPGGPGVRVDTFAYSGCAIPDSYDPLIAKLIVWDHSRPACRERLARALEEFNLVGTPSNLPWLQQLVDDPAFHSGRYDMETLTQLRPPQAEGDGYYQDLAVIAAILHEVRSQAIQPSRPDRLASGWHRHARRLDD